MLGIALRSLVAFLLNRTLALTRDLPPDKHSLVQASPQTVPTDGARATVHTLEQALIT